MKFSVKVLFALAVLSLNCVTVPVGLIGLRFRRR